MHYESVSLPLVFKLKYKVFNISVSRLQGTISNVILFQYFTCSSDRHSKFKFI